MISLIFRMFLPKKHIVIQYFCIIFHILLLQFSLFEKNGIAQWKIKACQIIRAYVNQRKEINFVYSRSIHCFWKKFIVDLRLILCDNILSVDFYALSLFRDNNTGALLWQSYYSLRRLHYRKKQAPASRCVPDNSRYS